jgi:transposase
MGDKVVRRKLFMGALGGVRGQNPLRAFYQRLVGRGKKKKLALVAAARKLLIWAWKVFQTQTDFDPAKLEHLVPV